MLVTKLGFADAPTTATERGRSRQSIRRGRSSAAVKSRASPRGSAAGRPRAVADALVSGLVIDTAVRSSPRPSRAAPLPRSRPSAGTSYDVPADGRDRGRGAARDGRGDDRTAVSMTSPETSASATARGRPAAEPRGEARDLTAADERPRRMDCLLRPRSVAVVGASANPSFVTSILKNLLRYGYAGPVVAVNPRYDRVLDAPCYPTILDVPHPLDLVVAGVPVRAIPTLLEQCEQKGVGALDIISSGFAEIGEEGARRQAELTAWARRSGIPVGGPNCLGLLHVPSGMIALPSVFERLIAGSVAVVLQSGLVAPSVLAPLFARGIGLTFGVTAGNEADLEAADYIRYFAADDETRVIGCFGEQIKTPARFVEACELAAARQKPIVMLKIGRSEASRRVAAAHTGSLVGSDGVVDAALRKLGVTRVASLDE